MHARDYRDIVGGMALVVIGAFAAIYGWATLSLGTVGRMGPGLFPIALGCILVVLGLIVLGPALFRAGENVQVDLRSTLAILGSVLAFALVIETFGMVPAIAILIFVASRADGRLSPGECAMLAAGLSLASTLIFRAGLGLDFSLFAWPF